MSSCDHVSADLECLRCSVLSDVDHERDRQVEKWGDQSSLPDGTGSPLDKAMAQAAREHCDASAQSGTLTWSDVLDEEVCESFAESELDRLEAELIQTAAVCVAWVESIRKRRE